MVELAITFVMNDHSAEQRPVEETVYIVAETRQEAVAQFIEEAPGAYIVCIE